MNCPSGMPYLGTWMEMNSRPFITGIAPNCRQQTDVSPTVWLNENGWFRGTFRKNNGTPDFYYILALYCNNVHHLNTHNLLIWASFIKLILNYYSYYTYIFQQLFIWSKKFNFNASYFCITNIILNFRFLGLIYNSMANNSL